MNLDDKGMGVYSAKPKLRAEGKWNAFKVGVNGNVGPLRSTAKIMVLTR